MAIEVIEERWIKKRCTSSYTVLEGGVPLTYRCTDHAHHMGSHHHPFGDNDTLFWPSEDDIADAKGQAELEAMSDEQVMQYLTDGDPEKRKEVEAWASASATFVQSGLKMSKRITELRGGLEKAVAEIKHHSEDYHHRTPRALLRELEELVTIKE